MISNDPIIWILISLFNLQLYSIIDMSQQKTQRQTSNKNSFDGLNQSQINAYAIGHFINDLTAACWFNYLLFFLKTIVKTSAASTTLLAGQLCDGIATPIVGYLVDKNQSKYGKRIPLYVAGLIIISISFIPIFLRFRSENESYEMLYYCFFGGIFNIGWASLQISHMSLVPALTCSRKRRDLLNNYRNTFTFIANLLVLLLGLCVFYFLHDKEFSFKVIAYSVLAIGILTSVYFIYHIDEPSLTQICAQKKLQFKNQLQKSTQKLPSNPISSINSFQGEDLVDTNRRINKNITESTVDDQNAIIEDVIVNQQKKENVQIGYWLRKPSFYLFGICYMCVRLNSNIFGTFIPFYLINVLKLSTNSDQDEKIPFVVALVPLIIYFSSSLSSLKLSYLYSKLGRAKTLIFGSTLSSITLILIYLLSEQTKNYIYLLAILIGISQSLVLATGINFISDVIGSRSSSGAFVFGMYSFIDKIATGVIIYLIAEMDSFDSSKMEYDQWDLLVIRRGVLLVPLICCIMGGAIVMFYNVSEYKQEKGQSDSRMQRDEFVHSVTITQ